MTNGKDVKPSGIMKKAIRYLIACIAILIWLGILANHWPTALAIAIIGGIIWRSRKSSQKKLPDAIPPLDPIPENTTHATQPSPSIPAVAPSIPGPAIAVEHNINDSIGGSTMPERNEVQWASYQDTLEVGSYRIEHPMTYWAAGKTSIAEASCIGKNLPVGMPVYEPIGALGYWPRYENMTPGQRGNYLSWLASGKQGQLDDIGYAFVYFYGLERRVFIDGKDVDLIIPEVVRLLCSYPESGSFNGYLSRFIAFSVARMGLRSITNDGFKLCFEQAPLKSYSEDLLAVILGWFYQHNHPLPASWAFEVARQDVRTIRSVVINRAPEQFKSLFMQKYRERFGEGLMLKAAERERLIEYHPASPSLLEFGHSSSSFAAAKIPDLLGFQSQFVHLSLIWNACVEDLRDFSRAVGKGLDTTTREAWEALPPALRKDLDHPDASRWKSIAEKHVREDGFSFATIAELAEVQGFQARDKLTATQSRSLAQTAEDVGLAIVPDARTTGRAYTWSDEVVLIQQENSAAIKQDCSYRAASCMLELGMIVAGADGTVDPEETSRIEQFLDGQFRLSSDDSRRLKAYGMLLSKKPPSISLLGKSLREALTLDQRAMIGKYLVGVAAANGIIDRKEISSLKRIYKALEIESSLDALLAELRQSGSQPVVVQTARREARAGELIPQHEQILADKQAGFAINYEALANTMRDTAEVAILLEKALRESECESDEVDTTENVSPSAMQETITSAIDSSLPFSTEQLVALDKRYYAPLAELLKQQVWSPEDLTILAKRHQLMSKDMLDTINTWSYNSLGDDILVEEDNLYKVDQSLMEG